MNSYPRYADENASYPYASPVHTEKPQAERPTPQRQGSVQFGTGSRSNGMPPPTMSLFSPQEFDVADSARSKEQRMEAAAQTEAEEEEKEALARWVTVFGFPASHSSIILSYFQNFGQILHVRHSESGGNWIHFMYMTKLQAEKALGKNGKILEGNIMIGVIRCSDPSVISDRTPTPVKSLAPTGARYNPTVPYAQLCCLFLLSRPYSVLPPGTFWHQFTNITCFITFTSEATML